MQKVNGSILIGAATLLVLISPPLFAQSASSERPQPGLTISTTPSSGEPIIFRGQGLPPGVGSPGSPTRLPKGRTRTGGCLALNPAATNRLMVALLPLDAKTGISYGTTTQERPTFWIYIPYRFTAPAYGELVLQNDQEQIVHRQTAIALSGTPGVIRIPLSAAAPPLEPGKTYRWYFGMYCGSTNQPDSTEFVGGYLQREALNPTLQAQLKQAPLVQQVQLYAANGIWYEALEAAAKLQNVGSSDRSWATLLQTVGLGNLAAEPITDCCKQE